MRDGELAGFHSARHMMNDLKSSVAITEGAGSPKAGRICGTSSVTAAPLDERAGPWPTATTDHVDADDLATGEPEHEQGKPWRTATPDSLACQVVATPSSNWEFSIELGPPGALVRLTWSARDGAAWEVARIIGGTLFVGWTIEWLLRYRKRLRALKKLRERMPEWRRFVKEVGVLDQRGVRVLTPSSRGAPGMVEYSNAIREMQAGLSAWLDEDGHEVDEPVATAAQEVLTLLAQDGDGDEELVRVKLGVLNTAALRAARGSELGASVLKQFSKLVWLFSSVP
jgi:hypothetical protein